MTKRLVLLVVLLIALRPFQIHAQETGRITSQAIQIGEEDMPRRINGVELSTLRGWFANRYPWVYIKEQAITHPLTSLWKAGDFQSPEESNSECWILNQYGSTADVLEYNANPKYRDHNLWLQNNDVPECRVRPYFLLYEHVHGTKYDPVDGPKNINLAINRRVFMDDIDFMVRNVIIPNQSRYVTISGRAVIYLWSTVQMEGDLASLLAEARAKYPVAFIGSVNIMGIPGDPVILRNFKAMDGFMEYAMVSKTFAEMSSTYDDNSRKLRQMLKDFQAETGKSYVFISTFQAGYDDSKVVPKRNNPIMYPRTKSELENHMKAILKGMSDGTYSPVGPFVVWSELYEGAAVIPSQCLPENRDTPTRFVGCGVGRLDLVQKYFSR